MSRRLQRVGPAAETGDAPGAGFSVENEEIRATVPKVCVCGGGLEKVLEVGEA